MALTNWIKRLLGGGAAPAVASVPPVPISPADWKALSEAVALALVPNEVDALTAEVMLALQQPQDYCERFAQVLELRGIENPEDVTPWLALIDGLQQREQCTEMDWKLDMQELIPNLQWLRTAQEQHLQFDALVGNAALNHEALIEAAAYLRPQGVALIAFDIQSDSYPLALLPSAQLPLIQELVKQVGEKIQVP